MKYLMSKRVFHALTEATMKTFFQSTLLIISVLFLHTGFAQDTKPDTLRPADRSFGAVLNTTGLISNITATPQTDLLSSSSLFMRYKVNDKFTFRLGVAPRIGRVNQTRTDSVGKDLVEYDSTASQSRFSLFPGVEYHLKGTKRLDPYVAADLELGLVGRLNVGVVENTSDTTGTSKVTRTITEDGGYAIGARLRLGMNYFIAPNLFLGVEYGLGFSTVISGGDREDVTQIDPVSGSSSVVRELSATRTNNLAFGVDPAVQITFGYFFSL